MIGDCEQAAGMLPPRAQTSATIAWGVLGVENPCSPSLRPTPKLCGLRPSSASMQTGWWYWPIGASLVVAAEMLRRLAPCSTRLHGVRLEAPCAGASLGLISSDALVASVAGAQ